MAIQTDHETIEKWAKALDLRKQGKTFKEVAAAVGYADPSGAYQAVVAALRMTLRESSEEVRTLEAERLDAMTAALWGRAVGADGAAPDYDALDRMLRVMDRRAKLLGLDAPTKHAVDLGDIPDDELIRRAEEALAGIAPPQGGGETVVGPAAGPADVGP